MTTHTIDCDYLGAPGVAAAYLLEAGDELAFVETNTTRALPLLLGALAQRQLRPEQVRYVIITHVHLDHAGGAGALMRACPSATLLAHPRAARHVIDPSRLVQSARAVYGDERFEGLYGEIVPVPAERVRALDDGSTVPLAGRELSFLHTRGHANHHFVVHDSEVGAVYTGDAFGIVYPGLQRGGLLAFPSTSPTDFDPEAAVAAVDRIASLGATHVYPTHMGRYDDVAGIADQLRPLLEVSGAILAEADSSGREGADLDAFCAERVDALFDDLLTGRGLGADGRARALVDIDRDLNGQGIAAAVRKRRYKRALHGRDLQ